MISYAARVGWLLPVLTACGDDGEGGGDTMLTGFSGVLIFGIIAWVVYSYVRRKS